MLVNNLVRNLVGPPPWLVSSRLNGGAWFYRTSVYSGLNPANRLAVGIGDGSTGFVTTIVFVLHATHQRTAYI